jgi:hypothetical protein
MISQLSPLCIRAGRSVDPKKETIVGKDEAEKTMKRPMRALWRV